MSAKNIKNAQLGGTTILVVLTLLVLLTVAALSMSKNSFREIQTGGFLRQGAMAKNVADSGIEWSIYWIDGESYRPGPGMASDFIDLKNALLKENALSGRAFRVVSGQPSMDTLYRPYRPGNPIESLDRPSTFAGFNSNSEPDFDMSFSVGLTRMGKLPVANMSQSSGYTPAAGTINLMAPDLWAIRSDAQVQPRGSIITFTHGREAWISTPVR
ncbi:MAG: hypothetical protein FWG12_07000 [Holophagaceae bacterium]|nr:hypothetical protein [Holophagaceae bacterium]